MALRRLVLLAWLALPAQALACGGRPKAERPQPQPVAARPLATFAARRVIVLPVRFLRPADTLGWATQLPADYLRSLDDELAFALGERGVKGTWIFPPELARSAKRNVPYLSDPYAVAVEVLRPPARRLPDDMLPEPLASQLRSLVALHDARYALLPVELRFESVRGATTGGGRAVLHLVMADARLARAIWSGEAASDIAGAPSPALAASLAGRLADLVAARP